MLFAFMLFEDNIDSLSDSGMEPTSCDYEMADAVIRDLGLRQETEPASRYHGQSTRVVSDWKANE